jgi:uncharacterized protein (DUF58 family)
MTPTGRAALAVAAIAVSALLLPWWIPVIGMLVVAAATGADALIVRRAPKVTRTMQPLLARGVPARLTLEAQATPGRVRVRQPATADLEIAEREGDGRLETTVVGRRRGRHVLPAPASRTVGPLGLARRHARSGEDAELLVYPDLPAARRLATAVRRGRFRFEGRARGPLGLGTEFESVRDYQPDDDVRQVNWRTTQRLGRPMSNQYRIERDRDVICVVDCGRLMAAPLGDRTRLDAAVDAAVAVAAVADALADRCGAIAFDATVRRKLAPRRAGGRAVVQTLFDVEPAPVDADYAAAFAAVGEAKRAFVIVLTDLLDESAARPLLAALPSLARRHAVAVASAGDPDLERMLTAEPRDRADVYRAAVALDVVRTRSRVAVELRRRAVDVVDAPPAMLGAACVRSYLRAKSRVLV